ncbi:MAG: tetratricopeptide repeat protein, partial [Candidatus Viridilinea halotolerans]
AIAEEQGAQSDLLIDQYRLLQRLSADMDRLQLAGGVLGPVVVAEADRVIAALTAHHDARFDELLTAITALRDAQRQSLINFAGAQMRDVNFQGDVAGRDVNKPTLAAGSTFVQGSVGVMQSIHAHEQSSIGSIIGQQVVHHHATPPPTPRYSIPPAFVRPAIALVGRAPLLDDLRQRLCCGTLRHLALYGKPGVGKSRMALELVADPTLRDHFTGGILVARAGVTENSETTIRAWIDDLGLHDDPRRTVAENLAYISQYIRRDGRPWLVVVDDVWRDSQLRPFLSLPEEVRLLITTRQRDLLLRLGDYLAPEALLELETLAHPDAIALLRATAGLPPDGNEQELDLLAQLVGGLPLILTVMGNYLRLRLLDNPAWFSKALVALRAAATRLNLPLVSLDLVEEQTKQRGWWASLLPFKRKPIQPLSPKAIIELSYATLPQTAQHILLSLAGFPPDPLSFDLASAKIVTERNEREVAEALLLLSQCSLLDGAGAGRWRMHQVLWDWAENYDRRRVTAAQQRLRRWHSDLMNPQYQQEFTAWRSQRDNWAQMLATWHDAQRDPDALALCIHTIVPALIAQAYWNDLLAGLKQALITLNKMASRQAEVALAHYYLGLIHYERAEYAAAEEQTSAAYAAFQAMHSQNGQSGALSLLGMIHKAMGNYPAAQGCYEDALALIPQRDEQNYAACLNNLAALYEEQGNYAAALPLYERALTIREQVLGAEHPDTATSL